MNTLTPPSSAPDDLRFRRVLGVLLALAGIAALLVGCKALLSPPGGHEDSQGILVSFGVLLLACGVLAGQWIAEGSRLSDALGATAISAMAWIFGWVTLNGRSENFSSSMSVGGAGISSSGGSASAARIAFGLFTILLVLAAGWSWRLVVRGRRQSS